MTRFRQEVLNITLAQILQDKGVVVTPESILTIEDKRNMPDVIIDYLGLRTAIEGEVGDAANAREKAIESARQRVTSGIAHIGIAVIYPSTLREKEFKVLRTALESAKIDFAIVTELEETPFRKGTISDLHRLLPFTFEHLVDEDVVTESVERLEAGIEGYASAILKDRGNLERVASALGFSNLDINGS